MNLVPVKEYAVNVLHIIEEAMNYQPVILQIKLKRLMTDQLEDLLKRIDNPNKIFDIVKYIT